jgi:hypothetical protein
LDPTWYGIDTGKSDANDEKRSGAFGNASEK